jgi:sugar phosphate isomerase/epimerase
MNIDEPDLPGAIRKAGALLAHMHGADSNRQAPGRGHTDFRPVVKALNEIGFKGTFVLEAVPPGANPGISTIMPENLPLRDIYAEESIRFLKQVEREVAQG